MVTSLICDEGRIKAVGFSHENKTKVVSSLKYLWKSLLPRSWLPYSSPLRYSALYVLFLFYDTLWCASAY